jgi:hypothetical protein
MDLHTRTLLSHKGLSNCGRDTLRTAVSGSSISQEIFKLLHPREVLASQQCLIQVYSENQRTPAAGEIFL